MVILSRSQCVKEWGYCATCRKGAQWIKQHLTCPRAILEPDASSIFNEYLWGRLSTILYWGSLRLTYLLKPGIPILSQLDLIVNNIFPAQLVYQERLHQCWWQNRAITSQHDTICQQFFSQLAKQPIQLKLWWHHYISMKLNRWQWAWLYTKVQNVLYLAWFIRVRLNTAQDWSLERDLP